MQRQILAYLRSKVGDSLPHSSASTESTPRTLGRGSSENVRGASSTPTPSDVRGGEGKPSTKQHKITLEAVLLSAIGQVKARTPHTLHHQTQAIYEDWKGELLAGGQVLTARGGTRYLHQKIRMEKREAITATGLDALLSLCRAFAFRDGLIKPNPRYTGKAPYPRFIRVGGE